MSANLNDISEKIGKILSEIPDIFALQNAKFYLKKAINEVNDVKIKREKRKIVEQSQQKQTMMLDYETAKRALNEIDKLIEFEKNQLNSFHKNDQQLLSD